MNVKYLLHCLSGCAREDSSEPTKEAFGRDLIARSMILLVFL